MCCFGVDKLNWHFTHADVKFVSFLLRARMSTKYFCVISLLILVLEWCKPNTEKCFETISESSKYIGRTNQVLPLCGETLNRTPSICLKDFNFDTLSIFTKVSACCAFLMVSIVTVPGVINFDIVEKSL
jgi:hypothetical protein